MPKTRATADWYLHNTIALRSPLFILLQSRIIIKNSPLVLYACSLIQHTLWKTLLITHEKNVDNFPLIHNRHPNPN